MRTVIPAVAALAAFVGSWTAQAQPRALDVPAAAAWQHAATGMILPPRSAGLQRSRLTDNTAEELDVIAQYSAEAGTEATVYLYRTQLPDVGLWYDRAVTTIAAAPMWNIGLADVPAPKHFSRPGATQPSGLLTAMNVKASARSTGVAIAPLGEWLVKVRMSSAHVDAAALEERMRAFMAGLRWPSPASGEMPARPIQACSEPLKAKRAKVVRPEIGNVLMSLVGSMAAVTKGPPRIWCRDPASLGPHGVYRAGGAKNAYTIALNDAGIALSIAPAITLEGLGGGGKSWSMTLLNRNGNEALLSFDRLPPPDQALAVSMSGGTGMSVTAK